jgi:hypothetical protein
MEERLSHILTLTNDWLKFAETKNTGLLVFTGALSLGVLQRVNEHVAPHVRYIAAIGLVLLAGAALCALASFNPYLKPGKLKAPAPPADDDNMIFFGHTAKYTPKEYLKRIAALSPPANDENSGIQEHYAHQIITNARIALRKYAWFSRGVITATAAIAALATAGILQLIAMK